MAEEKKSKQEEVQFPLNLRLLEEAAKIKEERKVIKERLEKIEASKGEVSATVYEKVRTDYLEQLNTNTDQILEKKQNIDRELATLYEAKKKVEVNVSAHKERLEEIEFRKGLGEFKKEDFHKLADEEGEKLGKFQKILAAIENNIKQYEDLFEGEEDLGEEPSALEAAPPPPPCDIKQEVPIKVEDDYHVENDDGYFGAVTEDVPAGEEMQETTKKDISKASDGEVSAAKLTITEGDGTGDIYELPDEEVTIGRASSNFIVLKEAKVSRQHASIKKHGKEYLIEDLHSSNGIFINDEKVKEHALSNGDIIKIGDFALKFTC